MLARIKFQMILVIFLLPVYCINATGITKAGIGGPGRISGCILDDFTHQPIEHAAVTLFSATDSSLIAGTITYLDGRFSVYMLSTGTYFLEISNPGYDDYRIDGLNIKVKNSRIEVGEVRVMASKSK